MTKSIVQIGEIVKPFADAKKCLIISEIDENRCAKCI